MTADLTIKNGKYHVILSWYITVNGSKKRKQKWISTDLTVKDNNKRKAEKRKQELLREYENKVITDDSSVLFSAYLINWLELTKNTISPNTYAEYHRTIHNTICPWFAEQRVNLCDLKPHHIQEFYQFKMEHDGVTANTIHHYHANLSKALKYAIKMGYIVINPIDSVELPKKQKHTPNYYSADELKDLLSKIKGNELEPVILLTSWFGLRRGEVLGLKWSCIDFNAKKLSVVGVLRDKGVSGSRTENTRYEKTAKTSSSLRSFPLTGEVIRYLTELKSRQDENKLYPDYNHEYDDFVCVRSNGKMITLDYITRAFPRLCEKYGLPRLTFHELRHTNISLLANSSNVAMKEIQEWAGHSSYNTTANVYSHIAAQSKNKLADVVSAAIR